MQIVKNSVVSINYEMRDGEGNLLEKSADPLAYLHGGYDGIFPVVEEMLHGKNIGDSIQVRMEPEDAFGDYDADLVRVEPLDLFPQEVQIGMQFEGYSEHSDESLLFTVTDIAEGKVVVDANHPYAGKPIQFTCTIAAVRMATSEELSHGHAHGEGGHHHH